MAIRAGERQAEEGEQAGWLAGRQNLNAALELDPRKAAYNQQICRDNSLDLSLCIFHRVSGSSNIQ